MDDTAFLLNASAPFVVVAENGSPACPLAFEKASVGSAVRVSAAVYNPATNDVLQATNIIYEQHGDDGKPHYRAYWLRRKVKQCIFGAIKVCIILKPRNDADVPWEITNEKAAVKIMSWQKIREIDHIEDPKKEVAAMQYISKIRVHPHVMPPLDVLQDEGYLFLFMPFCSSGELFSFVQKAGRFPEPMARYWFRQVIDGLSHLQRMGVCHRDMSLENMLVDECTRSIIIDLGMCLRVPFVGDGGSVVDASAGTLRLLMEPMVPCGKPNYMAPESLRGMEPFDGFSVDLWGASVMLFIMLVGVPPWRLANEDDPRYRMVTGGRLEMMLQSMRRPVSPAAADLLQNMLMADPRQRLSLMQVREHPWVRDETLSIVTEDAQQDEGWRL